VAVLNEISRDHFSKIVGLLFEQDALRQCYGVDFIRDILVGLLQLSLPDSPISQLPSPYWKRYVGGALAELRAGSPERYAEAVVRAFTELPTPHSPTVVVLPLAGVHTLSTREIGGVTLLPAQSCTADAELGGNGMFLRRLKALLQRGEAPVFAKLTIAAEPGLAVERALARTEQVCRFLRILPNPGLADGPLSDAPRIDLDAEDSAAFYISKRSVGTHPLPMRRPTSDPQGILSNYRVHPSLDMPAWSRLSKIIENGPACEIEARLLTALHHLGDALTEPSASVAARLALAAVDALIGSPDGVEAGRIAQSVALLTDPAGKKRDVIEGEVRALWDLRANLSHDLGITVTPAQRARATWHAFALLRRLLEDAELRGYRDLIEIIDRLRNR